MSLLERVVNKVTYTVNNSLTDPNADKWAIEQEKKKLRDAEEAANKSAEEAAKQKKEVDKAAVDSAAQKLKERKQFTAKQGLAIALKTFASVFLVLLIIAFVLHAGSLCANDAIARSILYRILFFVYAAIPFFSIFVLLYYHIYRRYKGTMPQILTVLPIRIQPELQSTLTGYLLSPFTYIPYPEVIEPKSEELKQMWDNAAQLLQATAPI